MNEKTGTQITVGLLSGLLGGCLSGSGPPVIIYGLARNWPKETFRTTLLAYFTILTIEAGGTYAAMQMFTPWCFKAAAAAIIPCLLTAWIGIRLKNKLKEEHFRRAVLIIIVLVGLIGLSQQIKDVLRHKPAAGGSPPNEIRNSSQKSESHPPP